MPGRQNSEAQEPTFEPLRRNSRRVKAPRGIVGYFLSDNSGAFIPLSQIQPTYRDNLEELQMILVDAKCDNVTLKNEEVCVLKVSHSEYKLRRLAQFYVPPSTWPLTNANECFDLAQEDSILEEFCGTSMEDVPGPDMSNVEPQTLGRRGRRQSKGKLKSTSTAKAVSSAQIAAKRLLKKARTSKLVSWGKMSQEERIAFREKLTDVGWIFGGGSEHVLVDTVRDHYVDPAGCLGHIKDKVRYVDGVGTFTPAEMEASHTGPLQSTLSQEAQETRRNIYLSMGDHYDDVRAQLDVRREALRKDLTRWRDTNNVDISDLDYAHVAAVKFVEDGGTVDDLRRIPSTLEGQITKAEALAMKDRYLVTLPTASESNALPDAETASQSDLEHVNESAYASERTETQTVVISENVVAAQLDKAISDHSRNSGDSSGIHDMEISTSSSGTRSGSICPRQRSDSDDERDVDSIPGLCQEFSTLWSPVGGASASRSGLQDTEGADGLALYLEESFEQTTKPVVITPDPIVPEVTPTVECPVISEAAPSEDNAAYSERIRFLEAQILSLTRQVKDISKPAVQPHTPAQTLTVIKKEPVYIDLTEDEPEPETCSTNNDQYSSLPESPKPVLSNPTIPEIVVSADNADFSFRDEDEELPSLAVMRRRRVQSQPPTNDEEQPATVNEEQPSSINERQPLVEELLRPDMVPENAKTPHLWTSPKASPWKRSSPVAEAHKAILEAAQEEMTCTHKKRTKPVKRGAVKKTLGISKKKVTTLAKAATNKGDSTPTKPPTNAGTLTPAKATASGRTLTPAKATASGRTLTPAKATASGRRLTTVAITANTCTVSPAKAQATASTSTPAKPPTRKRKILSETSNPAESHMCSTPRKNSGRNCKNSGRSQPKGARKKPTIVSESLEESDSQASQEPTASQRELAEQAQIKRARVIFGDDSDIENFDIPGLTTKKRLRVSEDTDDAPWRMVLSFMAELRDELRLSRRGRATYSQSGQPAHCSSDLENFLPVADDGDISIDEIRADYSPQEESDNELEDESFELPREPLTPPPIPPPAQIPAPEQPAAPAQVAAPAPAQVAAPAPAGPASTHLGFGITKGTADVWYNTSPHEGSFANKAMCQLFPLSRRLDDVNISGRQGRESLAPGGESNEKIQFIYNLTLSYYPKNPLKFPRAKRIKELRESMDTYNRGVRGRLQKKL